MFWQAIEQLHKWERRHLPGADAPQGAEILIWLLKSQNSRRPLKDLYRTSRYSEPTIRAYLRMFVARGFCVVESNGDDMRTRFARPTPKLEMAVQEYQQCFREVASLAEKARRPALRNQAIPETDSSLKATSPIGSL
jgi:hypothetical protein